MLKTELQIPLDRSNFAENVAIKTEEKNFDYEDNSVLIRKNFQGDKNLI